MLVHTIKLRTSFAAVINFKLHTLLHKHNNCATDPSVADPHSAAADSRYGARTADKTNGRTARHYLSLTSPTHSHARVHTLSRAGNRKGRRRCRCFCPRGSHSHAETADETDDRIARQLRKCTCPRDNRCCGNIASNRAVVSCMLRTCLCRDHRTPGRKDVSVLPRWCKQSG